MRKDDLHLKTRQDLLEIARSLGVKGRNLMNKDTLVGAIVSAGSGQGVSKEQPASAEQPAQEGPQPHKAPAAGNETRPAAAQRPRNREPNPPSDEHSEDEQNWNSVALGRDPNYGRFLNPGSPSAARDSSRPGPNRVRTLGPTRAESLAERSERGRQRASGGPQNAPREDPRRTTDRYGVTSSRVQGPVRRTERVDRGPRRGYRDPIGAPRSDRGGRDYRGYDPDYQRGSRSRSGPTDRNSAGRGAQAQSGHSRLPSSQPPIPDAVEIAAGQMGTAEVEILKGTGGAQTGNEAAFTAGAAPESCGVDRCKAMIREPRTLHVHWEIGEQTEERAHRELGEAWGDHQRILRVHAFPVQGSSDVIPSGVFDVEIQPDSTNAQIEVPEAERGYRVDVGLINRQSLFFPMASSNVVVSPKNGGSRVPEERRMVAPADGTGIIFGEGPSAEEVTLDEGGHTRLAPPPVVQEPEARAPETPLKAKGRRRKNEFRFELNTELVVHGSTEPDARVTIQGEPVEVRSDGTFSLRVLLPDGTQTIEVAARSADGLARRVVTPIVSRATRHETEGA